MTNLTVPGPASSAITLDGFSDPDSLTLAQAIANALAAAKAGSVLAVTAAKVAGGVPAATVGGGTVNELVLIGTVSGATSVPAGYGFWSITPVLRKHLSAAATRR